MSGDQPWRVEARAMFALAMPLILGNVAQSVIWATDLVLLGRLGPDALAAASLGINVFIPFIVFASGLLSAVAPIIAQERGRRRHAVREVRRTVRQGLWVAVTLVVPSWLVLTHTEDMLRAMGQDADIAEQAGVFVDIVMWSLLPFAIHVVLRNAIAAFE